MMSNPFEEAFTSVGPQPPPRPAVQPSQNSPSPPRAASLNLRPSAVGAIPGDSPHPSDVSAHETVISPFAQPAGQRPAFAPSAATSVAGAATHEARTLLASFQVDKPIKGNEVLRPITYFRITTTVLVDNDGHFTVPDVPQGPHLYQIDSGIRRNDWTRGSHSVTDRRYSELVDLRELLVYQFPTLIIPPLPAKSKVRDVETFFNAPDGIAVQQADMKFFLSEIAAIPEIIFFSAWVPPFFLDPRDSFETSTLVRMRAELERFRTACKSIDDLSQRRRGLADDAANLIAGASSKLVRSVVSLFRSAADDKSAAAGVGQSADTSAVDISSTMTFVAGDWSSLPADDNADACAWERTMALLINRRKALRRSAKTFEAYLAAENARMNGQIDVAQAMEGYKATLAEAGPAGKLGEPCHLAALVTEEMAEKQKRFAERRYVNVCMRLKFETNYIDSVLDAADRILSIYRASPGSSHGMGGAWKRYANDVSRGLRVHYLQRYKRAYAMRMRSLVMGQIVIPASEAAAATDSAVANSAFVSLIKDPSFATYNNGSA